MFDIDFSKILKKIMAEGVPKHNRTGIDTLSVFNTVIECDEDSSGQNIPLSNLRKIYFKGALIEAMWILGLHMQDERYKHLEQTNTKYLEDNNVNYWKPWQDKDGNLGPVYGAQLVSWPAMQYPKYIMCEEDARPVITKINQIENVIAKLRVNPDDRRLVCTMWNPAELDKMALPPCHYCMEFYSRPLDDGTRALDVRWVQRSADLIIGIPYDVIIYTMINKMIALCTGHKPGRVIGVLGDTHVYDNQKDAAGELLNRFDTVKYDKQPKLVYSDRLEKLIKEKGMLDLCDFAIDGSDFKVVDYNPSEAIKIPVAV